MNPWPRLLRLYAVLALPILLAGWLGGRLLEVALAAALAAAAWHFYNVARMERWLRLERKLDPPLSRGLWGEVFDGLYRQRKRQRGRQKKLRQLLRRYRDSAKAMPDATVVLRRDYRVEWWNDAASTLLGLSWPTDEGQRITNIYRHPEFVAFMERPERSHGTATLPSPVNEHLHLEIRLVPYGEKQYLLLARDVTHLVHLETMRRDFVANVSHELRTPLTVIYGVSETLEDELGDHPELTDSVHLLQEQAQRMKLLVDDLLLLSRLETAAEPDFGERVEVVRLLEQLVEEGRVLSGEAGHTLSLEAEPGWCLAGSEGELRSAFANLIGNAVKYTPPGGRIAVRWRVDEAGGHCEVADDGPGIAGHHLPRLTERFYRIDDGRTAGRGGTGLGLAIVKHVMVRHGGELVIQSALGRGSTFRCRFPRERLFAATVTDPSRNHQHGVSGPPDTRRQGPAETGGPPTASH